MAILNSEKEVLRELAKKYREIAFLPIQEQNINNWKAINSLRPIKPMLMIDQIPWHEFSDCEELSLQCQDDFCRELELQMRQAIYRWKYFPCDMVVKKYITVPKICSDSGIGITSQNREEDNRYEDAQSHLYKDQIQDEEALKLLHPPVIHYDREQSEHLREKAADLIGDILPIRLKGAEVWSALWDRIVFLRGVTPVLFDLMDRPEFLHQIMSKMVEFEMKALDQLENENLLDHWGFNHYCEGYCDELTAGDYDEDHPKAKNCWVSGAAQIFSEVSPAMHDEFEIQHMKPFYERFGLVNYGCCEPLHNKIDIIKQIKNVRYISMSPWANVDIGAEAMGKDYGMARKPNPAFLASDQMDIDAIRSELLHTMKACIKNGTPVVFILKDLTTIRSDPFRLQQWYELAKSIVESI